MNKNIIMGVIPGLLGLTLLGGPSPVAAGDPPPLEPPAIAPAPIPAPPMPATVEPARDVRRDGPPTGVPADEPGPAPGPGMFYIPGQYVPVPAGEGVTWRGGFWARSQPGWEWVPARWVRLAEGWTYREGHWERSIARQVPGAAELVPPTELVPLPEPAPQATPGPAPQPAPRQSAPQPGIVVPPVVVPGGPPELRLPVTEVFLPGGLHIRVVPGQVPWIGRMPRLSPPVAVPQVHVMPGPTVREVRAMVRDRIEARFLESGGRPVTEAWRLGLLFGAIYFLQGIGEPTEGLIAQPTRSLLKTWGCTAATITGFMALLSLPWTLKPLFGLLTDFVPVFGTRRKSYLLIAAGAMAASLLGLYAFPVGRGASAALLGWLLVPTFAVALADVAADALMIERGQPLGLTGRLQAVQWGCLYAADIVTGLLGGLLSTGQRQDLSFLICGITGLLTLALVLVCVREPRAIRPRPAVGASLSLLASALRPAPGSVLAVGGFLFLWSFNPFSNAVLHIHMTSGLGFSEQFYGQTRALTAVASIAASVGYALYCRRVPLLVMVHASIVLGILSTLGYAWVVDVRSAVLVTLATSVTYMTATLIQLDLAAQYCPPAVAGTVFAVLMALENLSASLSIWFGGHLYDRGIKLWGSFRSFQVLVLIGSALTACCWFIVPLLPRPERVD